ncbi:MAG: alpha/beta hydrolase [Proteobacteria bacterium]|jgi:pimeloyl-ACP methyl ester carboxylesterase|nr:alpha/beta hydrolase [Pseudomonadota bacterium]
MDKKLNCIEFGNSENQTIVFLHGLGATHRYWLEGLDKLTPHFHVVLLDLLGFGDSPRPWQIYTQEKHILAINDVLKNYSSFILIGHSLGAALSLAYAEHYPKHVKGLILISLPLFNKQPDAYKWMRRTPSGWLLTNMLATALICVVTRFLARKLLHHFLKQYPKEIIDDLVKHNMFSSTTSLWKVIYNQSILNDLVLLRGQLKIVCIHAINDKTAPYTTVQDLVKDHVDWVLYTLNAGDHHPWLWQKEKCIKIIKGLF